MSKQRRPRPVVEPGQAVIDVYEPRRDMFGRVGFLIDWYDEDLPVKGGTGTTRGQVFHADEREHIRKALKDGEQVFMLGRAEDDDGTVPDWTGPVQS